MTGRTTRAGRSTGDEAQVGHSVTAPPLLKVGTGRGGLRLDAGRLVGGCAMVQGTRGTGKSYLVRVIVEQLVPQGVQTIVIDPEGEYGTLREQLDVLLAGPGGDVPVDVHHAKLLARRIAELGASTVVNISDLKSKPQGAYVADFVASLNQLPKRLERPRFVVIDEAHRFAPEAGKGRSVATEPIKLLMSQGRKRGLGAMLVTQRLSKLTKDAAAEAGTVFVLRTSPVDQARAQDLLGLTKKEATELRELEDGEVYAVGLAVCKAGPTRFRCRRARTTHPEPGTRFNVRPPPPREAIRALLEELSDLPPAETDGEAESLAEAREALVRLRADLERERREREDERSAWEVWRGTLATRLDQARALVEGGAPQQAERPPALEASTEPARKPAAERARQSGKRRMLAALAQHRTLGRRQLALMIGMSAKGGTFSTYLSAGRTGGLWTTDAGSGQATITEEGLARALKHGVEPLPSGPQLLSYWCRHKKVGITAGRMLRTIVAAGDQGIAHEQLATEVGLSVKGGTFSTYL